MTYHGQLEIREFGEAILVACAAFVLLFLLNEIQDRISKEGWTLTGFQQVI